MLPHPQKAQHSTYTQDPPQQPITATTEIHSRNIQTGLHSKPIKARNNHTVVFFAALHLELSNLTAEYKPCNVCCCCYVPSGYSLLQQKAE